MKTRNVGTTLSMLGLLGLLACGTEPVKESPDAEACEHLAEGPSMAVTPATTRVATDAPHVSTDHRRYDVALAEVFPLAPNGKNGGWVKFAVSEATDYRVYLDKDVPFFVIDEAASDGDNVVIIGVEEEAKSSSACAEIKARYTFPLGVGTYTFEFGPTSETEVRMVVEEATHDEAHAH